MTPQTYVTFAAAVTLRMFLPSGLRQRVSGAPPDPVLRTFERLPLLIRAHSDTRYIVAYLPPVPAGLALYGPEDFAAACADTMDDHSGRVLQLLGSDPATVLQALIDGGKLPDPPQRVPREIANWRGKVVLASMGKLAAVDALIAAMPEPDSTVMRLAWSGNAAMARRSQAINSIALALGMTEAEVDAFFIASAAINL